MKDLTFITGNQHKADFLSRHLGLPLNHRQLDLDELQSLDIHEVVEHKVRQAYDILHKPVIVEDNGLIFTAMGRLPGTFIKWFLEEIGNEGLVKMAHALPDQSALGVVSYGLFDGNELHLFDGEMRGTIAHEEHDGEMGFGFDPIFINEGYEKARSEMTQEEYDKSSYRTHAINAMRTFLTE